MIIYSFTVVVFKDVKHKRVSNDSLKSMVFLRNSGGRIPKLSVPKVVLAPKVT